MNMFYHQQRIHIFSCVIATVLCAIADTSSAFAASFQGLGSFPGERFDSFATAVSADGSTVVGTSYSNSGEAFRWTQAQGIQPLEEVRKLVADIESELPAAYPDNAYSTASDVSADGSTVVGDIVGILPDSEAFRWNEQSGVEILDIKYSYVNANGVSADGSTVVGSTDLSYLKAFRWTKEQGLEEINNLSSNLFESAAAAVSADGSTIVGTIRDDDYEAFRWTEDKEIQRLGDLNPNSNYMNSFASNVSADGSTVVGSSISIDGRDEAFRWTQETGMQGLGDLPGGRFFSRANAVSADGSIVVGYGTNAEGDAAFIWNEDNQMRSLQQVLTNEFALDLTGWELSNAADISDDGLTIVGNGINPQGNREGWIARLDSKPVSQSVPEPSLLLGITVTGGLGILFKKLNKSSLKA